ncbi:DUF917 domain-containing protein [Streptomyces sp. NRRL F-5053]|uniref:DUF917 domain-containing protein n=1 Tax=Streptomyces sp. NRRL F-5053 TaxID=1463854 RepID=UPI000689DF79|nr:DUF917 domain-containing protein [Streptomyces sp. NRRL F-5053]
MNGTRRTSPHPTAAGPAGLNRLTPADLPALAAGATLLGSGGGGDVALPARLLRHTLAAAPVPVVPAAALPEDALVIHAGEAGAPDVLSERLPCAEDFARAVRAVETATGRTADAVGIIEIGGLNALAPALAAAELGLPVLDGDLMGRALPRIDQTTLALDGHPACPFALTSPAGDTVLVPTCTPRAVEPLLHADIAALGGAAALALHPVTAGTLRTSGIPGSLTACVRLGERYLAARDAPPAELAARLGARLLCAGRIDELRPRHGAETGSVTLHDHRDGAVVRVDLLDELLAVTVDGETLAATPDIIVAVDAAGHAPLRCDQLRTGRTVLILHLPALHRWPPEAAHLVGPRAYGLTLTPATGKTPAPAGAAPERSST